MDENVGCCTVVLVWEKKSILHRSFPLIFIFIFALPTFYLGKRNEIESGIEQSVQELDTALHIFSVSRI